MDKLLELPEEKELSSRSFPGLLKQVVGAVEDNQQSLRTSASYRLSKIFAPKLQEKELGHVEQAIKLLNVDLSSTSIAELLSHLKQGIIFALKIGYLTRLQRDQ